MNSVTFSDRAWADYLYWQTQDKKTLRRVNMLIDDIKRSNYEGLGKPEALVGDLSGFWSRRIDDQNRIIYRVTGGTVEIVGLRTHYE